MSGNIPTSIPSVAQDGQPSSSVDSTHQPTFGLNLPLSDKALKDHFPSLPADQQQQLSAYVRQILLDEGAVSPDNPPSKLKSFNVPQIETIKFYQSSHATKHYNSKYPYSKEEVVNECIIHTFQITLYVNSELFFLNFIPLVKESLLFTPAPSVADSIPSHVKASLSHSFFERNFENKKGILYSFLDYLSRHYGKESKGINPSFKYYSPVVSIHQSSGSGKVG